MNKDFDIIIIGAGFAGASTAYHLSQNFGGKILLLERETSYGQHASGKNAALLRQAVSNLQAASWMQETLSALKNPPQDWRQPNVFRKTGSLILGDEKRIAKLFSILDSLSVDAQIYSSENFPKELDSPLKSFLQEADYQVLLHSPGDGVVDIHALLGNYLHAAMSRGVQLKNNSEVKKIHCDQGQWIVECQEEHYVAKVVVNAAGAWVNQIALSCGLEKEEISSYRRHLYISEPVARVHTEWPFLWNVEQEFYLRPESGGLLLCPGDEELHPPSDPATDPRMSELLAIKLQKFFPALAQVSIRRSWACLRTKTKNDESCIDWDSQYPGFFWVAALGGHGMGASFGVGKRAAEKISSFFS